MMLTQQTLEELETSFGDSTMSNNLYASALDRLDVEHFEADGELYYVFDNAILTTPSTNAFDCDWHPEVYWRTCGEVYIIQ